MAGKRKTSIEDEIMRAQKRLEILRKRKQKQKQAAALQFFTKNNIDMLLESPEELQKFTKEIQPVIEKLQTAGEDKAAEGDNDE